MASRHIIRTALQQLSDAGLITMKETKTVQSVDGDQKLYSGRIITPAGHKLLDEVAHSVERLQKRLIQDWQSIDGCEGK